MSVVRRLHASSIARLKAMPSKEHHHQPISDAVFPHGFLATGLHVGVKNKQPADSLAEGPKDFALVVSTTARTSSAATFTRNVFKAAPVQVSTDVLHGTRGRANKLILNSGCANAVTGTKGLEDAWRMARATDEAFPALSNVAWQPGDSKKSASTLVMSTGVIGQLLPINKILEGIKSAATTITRSPVGTGSFILQSGSGFAGWERAARAFMTTDTFPKLRARTFTLPSITASKSPSTFRIAGIDKGAGMIHPNMGPPHATLLGLIVTDAPIAPLSLQNALTYAVDRSFNSISVDGDMSTNDTVVAFANGAALGPDAEEIDEEKHPEAFLAFRNELTSFAIDLAKLIVYDGEGATKFVTVTVKVRRLVFRFGCSKLNL
jgi:glutamate N-acetyltransferase/amino-acid N-acetyltransferase